jgi:hypothetical protein
MKILHLIFLLFAATVYSQPIKETAFINVKWFALDGINTFTERDSVALFSLTASHSDQPRLKADFRTYFNNNSPVTDLKFERNGNLLVKVARPSGWCGTRSPASVWAWKFDEASQQLEILHEDIVMAVFKVISREAKQERWKQAVDNNTYIDFYAEYDAINLVRLE